ncbi:dtw domain-containing protein 2 [Pitangus sulphuratus]|nr:dtw domain-containing protein 2 [Pitangus sulphuratus]
MRMEMNEELTKTLWVRIKGKAGTGDITVGVCYRRPIQEDQANESFRRQTGADSHSQALVLMEPNISWRNKKFPECVDEYFLLQVIEEPMRRGVMLDLVLANKEGLEGNVKLKVSLGCSDHEMV